MEHTPENLEEVSKQQETQKQNSPHLERPLFHRILALILVAVVLFGFLGTCHWLATYGR